MKRKAKRILSLDVKKPCANFKIPARKDDGFGTSMPPSFTSVQIYFDQKGLLEVAGDFFAEQEKKKWKTPAGQLVANWKVCAADWIYDYRQELKRRLRQSPFYSELFY